MRAVLMVVVVACAAPREVVVAELGDRHEVMTHAPTAPVKLARKAMVDSHMREHMRDLRAVDSLLIAGKLVAGTSAAFMLTRPTIDAGLAPWDGERDLVTCAAFALNEATSMRDARRHEARVIAACAHCHVATQVRPSRAPPMPAGDGARHRWAIDRLWGGMIFADDRAWRSGMTVLAASLLQPSRDALDLQRAARDELDSDAPATIAHRTAAYRSLLVTCTACHVHR